MALSTLAPGMRANATDLGPTAGERMGNREFQLNIDGQEVSVAQGGNRGQPRFSRDAIGEFQFLSSRFDATQGRSSGLQVNAITKSGTNLSPGSFSGYFRKIAVQALSAEPQSPVQIRTAGANNAQENAPRPITNLRHQREIVGPDVYRTVNRSSSALKRG